MAERVFRKAETLEEGAEHMSLINSESQKCAVVIKASVPDDEGGQITRFIESKVFDAVITPNLQTSSGSKTVGDKEVSAKSYKILYPNDVGLKLNDVIKSKTDDKVYKITGDGSKSANASSIKYSVVSAEDWSLPYE